MFRNQPSTTAHSNRRATSCKKDHILRPFLLLIVYVLCLVTSTGLDFVATTDYWLNLLGRSAERFLLFLFPVGVFLYTLNWLKSQRNLEWQYFVVIPVLFLACLLMSALFLVGLVGSSYDLFHGPVHSAGVVENTESFLSKYGRTNTLTVQGTSYQVADYRWFQTLVPGQEIEFLYGPMTHSAYPLPSAK